ncbi:lymphocyte antigen 6 complex locus protein G6c [Rhinoderma darwinii]|uniref:lymphocyte antigen 6 complex locus protein G6c n=1 Tax=Rhinoderma darwinii TaxID=43563 RepID=UPI003F67EAF3
MKSFLCISLVLGLIAIASALTCKKCDFRAVSFCFSGSSNVECTGNCSQTRVALGSVSLFSKLGCAKDCQAVQNKTDSVFEFQYNTTCCLTDLCNNGNSIKTSLSLGLGMGLLWLLNAV